MQLEERKLEIIVQALKRIVVFDRTEFTGEECQMTDRFLADIVKSMREVYKSIDLRTAAVLIDGKWCNILTVARFSHEDVEEIKGKYEMLESRWGRIEGDGFRIMCESMDFSEWDNLLLRFSEGKISINELEVNFDGKKELASLKCDLRDYPQSARKTDEWSIFEGLVTMSADLYHLLGKVEQNVRLIGFPSIYAAISEWLQVKFASASSIYIVVCAPIYARIEDVDFSEQRAEVSVKSHEKMHGLRLNAVLWKSQGIWGENYEKTDEIKDLGYVDLDTIKLRTLGEFSFFRWLKELPTALPIDYLDVRLIYPTLMALEIDKRDDYLSRYLHRKSAAENPFFNVFHRFCNWDEFIKQLREPRTYKSGGKLGPDKIFERAISWLLSLCGLSVIRLDEFEKFKAKGDKTEYDSVDLLAYDKEKTSIFIVNCTVGVPKVEEDIPHLIEVKHRLHDELFKGLNMQIIPAIFSSYTDLGPNKEAGRKHGVKIVDGSDIEKLMIMVRDRKTHDAFILLTSI